MSSEGQRIVQEFDSDGCPGRHRAPASAARWLSARIGIATFGVLLAVGLGAATADVLGLTEVGQMTSQNAPPRVIPPDTEEEPRAGRTTDRGTRPVPPSAQPDVVPADPAPERPAPSAVVRADRSPPRPSADRAPSPAPPPRVRTGDTCRSVGQTGVTARGSSAVCTASPGKGPNKWRVP